MDNSEEQLWVIFPFSLLLSKPEHVVHARIHVHTHKHTLSLSPPFPTSLPPFPKLCGQAIRYLEASSERSTMKEPRLGGSQEAQ